MKLDEYLHKDQIDLDVKAKDKRDVLEKLVALLSKKYNLNNEEEIVSQLLEREGLGSTGLGEGIALPHIRSDDLFDRNYIAALRTKKPVNFDAIDGVPCRIFFLVLGPESNNDDYLKIMATISRIMRNEKNRNLVLEAETPKELKGVFIENGID